MIEIYRRNQGRNLCRIILRTDFGLFLEPISVPNGGGVPQALKYPNKRLRDSDAAVPTAGAAECHREVRLTFTLICRERKGEEIRD